MFRIRSIERRATIVLIIVALLLSLAYSQPFRVVVVDGESMAPTYQDKTFHLMTPMSGQPFKGEVVVLSSPEGTLIKRVAFLPGDFIRQIKIGNSWVDVLAPSAMHKKLRRLKSRTYMVPKDEVYVLGDNGPKSLDSRTFGPLPIHNISGELADQKPPVLALEVSKYRAAMERVFRENLKHRHM